MFVVDVVIGLIGYLVMVISGGNLYCKLSFLFDYFGKIILLMWFNISECLYVMCGLVFSLFDSEGVCI